MWGKKQENVVCSEVQKRDTYIEFIAWQKIECLMDEYDDQEWLAYLVGKQGKSLFVEDIIVPPHKQAHGASAEAEPFHVPKDCVGIIHSHHTMGAFHSVTDQNYVDRNYPVSITVAMDKGNLSFDAVSYQKTPCGKNIVVKSTVRCVSPPPMFDRKKWLSKAKKNIEKGNTQTSAYLGNAGHFQRFGQAIGRVLSPREVEDVLANTNWDDG